MEYFHEPHMTRGQVPIDLAGERLRDLCQRLIQEGRPIEIMLAGTPVGVLLGPEHYALLVARVRAADAEKRSRG